MEYTFFHKREYFDYDLLNAYCELTLTQLCVTQLEAQASEETCVDGTAGRSASEAQRFASAGSDPDLCVLPASC